MTALLPAPVEHADGCACGRCVAYETAALVTAGLLDRLRDDTPSVLTVVQAAAYLQVSVQTVYRAVAAGDLPARRVGRELRLVRRALDEHLAAGKAV